MISWGMSARPGNAPDHGPDDAVSSDRPRQSRRRGGVNSAAMQVTFFPCWRSPSLTHAGVNWAGTQTVTWNVAGTTANPINVANVNILLSTNGGATFPIVLATNTPNDGPRRYAAPILTSSAESRSKRRQYLLRYLQLEFQLVVPRRKSRRTRNAGIGRLRSTNGVIDPEKRWQLTSRSRIPAQPIRPAWWLHCSRQTNNFPSSPQNYGFSGRRGSAAARPFSFTAAVPRQHITALLQLQDGSIDWEPFLSFLTSERNSDQPKLYQSSLITIRDTNSALPYLQPLRSPALPASLQK